MELNTANFFEDITRVFESDGDLDLAVAFVSNAGLALVHLPLEQKLASGRRVRLLLDLQEGATDPTALWSLVALAQTYSSFLYLESIRSQ